MAPVLKSLPYLVKKVANYELTQFRGLEAFHMHRIPDLYINERTGRPDLYQSSSLKCTPRDPSLTWQTSRTPKSMIFEALCPDIYKTIVLPAYYGR
ncbi:hypothetical protein Bca52824_064145 [Brassica carinata]|uniref:Uncharacterized protein n=1 Tax=Brassica carinata TaxID=52824 RepID=A0A8X7QJ44_BRACI|nr:hypothetical protein Bca52824_064145 [Brassica carinata]